MSGAPREVWLPLPGFDGWIDVSSRGRARRWYGRRSWFLLDEPEIVPITVSSSGYCSFSARAFGRRGCRMPLHVAVLLAFSGLPAPFAVACHFPDPDRGNCRFDNLRWDTRGANHLDAKIHHSGLTDRVAARLAILRRCFPHLREDVDGIALQARTNIYANNGLHMKRRAEERRARELALVGGAA